MGVEIVKAATVYGRRLSGNAYKVLVAMSLSALDKPTNGRPASLYWGGWDALALALGHPHADRNSAGHNAVARAVRELRKAGHITPMVDAGRGTRQSYLVHPGGVNGPKQGEQNAHAKGEQSAHTKGEQNAPHSVSKMLPPRKELGGSGLNQDHTTHPSASTTDPGAQGRAEDESSKVEPHAHVGGTEDPCGSCGNSRLSIIHARRRRVSA